MQREKGFSLIIILFLVMVTLGSIFLIYQFFKNSPITSGPAWIPPLSSSIPDIYTPSPISTSSATPFDTQIKAYFNTGSMEPNYPMGQGFNIKPLVVGSALRREEIIEFKQEGDPSKLRLSRIIALPGEEIVIKEGSVYINGEQLIEPYLKEGTKTDALNGTNIAEVQQVEIPLGNYFVMGDNRNHSADSRMWGLVRYEDIIGTLGECISNCSKP